METLHPEILEVITEHLTAQELATCAAVCLQWREIFNNDILWRPRCTITLEGALKTSTCVVEPSYISPEIEGGTLSPLGKWRLAFMRENHLWNNWRQRNFRYVHFRNEHSTSHFVSDHLIIKIHNLMYTEHLSQELHESLFMIELYDITKFPPILLKQTTHKYDYHPRHIFQVNVINNTLVLFYGSDCIAFDLQISPETILKVKYKIGLMDEPSWVTLPRFKMSRSAILGYHTPNFSLQVWDFKEGTELKVETSPIDKSCKFIDIETSKTTDNAVVVVSSDEVHSKKKKNFIGHFYIYNTLEHRYLSFTQVREGQYYGGKCTIHYNYLTIAIHGFVKVYNYQTHKQLTEVAIKDTDVEVIDDCFVFISNSKFKMFHPVSQTFITIIDLRVQSFRLLGSSMVLIFTDMGTQETWRIRRKCQERLPHTYKCMKTNESSTRAIKFLPRLQWVYYW